MKQPIFFYEKQGCMTNTKQKKLLNDLGYTVFSMDLLTHPFTKEELRSFFGDNPIKEWFNPNAPKIKKGEISPENMNEEEALETLIANPIMIRRPLIRFGDFKYSGFEKNTLQVVFKEIELKHSLEGCSAAKEENA